MFPNTHKGAMTPMKFTITSDPVEQYQGRGNPGRYDEIFRKLTPEANCLVFDDFAEMEKVAQAMGGWIKRVKLKGGKVKTTKAYPADNKPRCWLVYPEGPRTQIRGPFPGRNAQ